MSATITRAAPGGRTRAPSARAEGPGRWLGAAAAIAGVAYTASWAAGLALPVPNLAVTASGTDVIARYGSHLAAVQAQFALTQGLPAIGPAIVAGVLALAARRAGARRVSLITAVSGAIAAVISLTQYALGVALGGRYRQAGTPVPYQRCSRRSIGSTGRRCWRWPCSRRPQRSWPGVPGTRGGPGTPGTPERPGTPGSSPGGCGTRHRARGDDYHLGRGLSAADPGAGADGTWPGRCCWSL